MKGNEMKGNELALLPKLNFEVLNTSIEKLGEAKKLTDKEKEIGVSLLNDWQVNVLDKLDNKSADARKLRDFFKGNYVWFREEEEEIMKSQIAKKTKTEKEYAVLEAAKKAEAEYERKSPKSPITNPNKSVIENDLEYGKYELEEAKWNIEMKKLKYSTSCAERKWLVKMNKTAVVKNLLLNIGDYLKQLSKYRTQVKDKAHLAKINIAISDDKVRTAIREMIDFTKDIN